MMISPIKAAGIGQLSARLLQITTSEIAPSVTKLINYSLETAVFPRRWKTAEVTPLFEGDNSGEI